MFKLVLDTNTIISGFLWRGNEFELLQKIEESKALLFVNKEILMEIDDVITRPKFRELLSKAGLTADQLFSKIVSLSHLVIGPKLKEIIINEDQADDKFLECAVNSKADYIVSGDKHLLELKGYRNIQIVRTSEILELI